MGCSDLVAYGLSGKLIKKLPVMVPCWEALVWIREHATRSMRFAVLCKFMSVPKTPVTLMLLLEAGVLHKFGVVFSVFFLVFTFIFQRDGIFTPVLCAFFALILVH